MGVAVCTSSDPTYKKLNTFIRKHEEYNNEPKTNFNKKGEKRIQGHEIKLNEHFKIFMSNKDELYKTNKELFKTFFNKESKNNTEFYFKGISSDDEKKFLFFFNLRIITAVTIVESCVFFPKFCVKYFPKFKPEESCLKSITINDSEVIFNDSIDDFSKIKQVTYLDLSFNNITALPVFFKRLDKLKFLSLKRNKLSKIYVDSTLPLEELDLSENEFKKFPETLLFLEKLKKLNMNSNQIDVLEASRENHSIEYLYLANNYFLNIPSDIILLKKLKHLSLDINKITEINPTIFNETKMNLKITLSNNNIKTREGLYSGFKNDILTYPPPDMEIKNNNEDKEIDKVKRNDSSMNFINLESEYNLTSFKDDNEIKDEDNMYNQAKGLLVEDEDLRRNEIKLRMQFKKTRDRLIDEINYKNCFHVFEIELRTKIKNTLQQTFKKPVLGLDERGLADSMAEEKRKLIKEFLNDIIARKQDAEISKFQDVELRVDIKSAYSEILEEKRILNKKKEGNNEVISNNNNNNEDEKKAKTKKDDLSNLTFLKSIHSIITSSKIKLLLQYLRNIDESLYKYFKDLTDEYDKDNLVLLLIELKLFLNELITYYKQNIIDQNEIIYEMKLYSETNVINKIFKENTTLKMLYTLGLSEIKISSIETVIININNVYHIKHKLLESFLRRLINEIKVSKNSIIID